MALVVKDRVRETSTSTGTGTITLNGAVTGFQSFTVIGNTNTTYYTIVDGATGAWEVGIGTYTSSGTLLSRDTILESSNAGSAVDFAAGIKDVFCTYPAERSVDSDTAQTLTNKTLGSGTAITAGTINGAIIGGSTAAAGTFTSLTDSGNLTFTGTGNRITGDFSNATIANRVAFQTSTTNTQTIISVIPNGTATQSQIVAVNNSDPTNSSTLRFISGASDAQIQAAVFGTGTYLPMTFYTGGSEKVRIDTSGNLNYGITGSSTYALRQVYMPTNGGTAILGSAAYHTTNAYFDGAWKATATGGSAQYLQANNVHTWSNAASVAANAAVTWAESMRIDSSGNVGIGTTSPQAKLTVSASGASGLEFFANAPGGGAGTYIQSYNRSGAAYVNTAYYANAHTFWANGSDRMVIDSSGNVGIGTSTATYKTNIVYTNSAGGVAETGLYLRNTATGNSTQMLFDGNRSWSLLAQGSFGAPAGGFTIQDNTAGANRLSIDASGNVGIGTSSPGTPLDVVSNSSGYGISVRGRSADDIGVLRFLNNAGNSTYAELDTRSNLFLVNARANIPLLFATNNTERMRIDSSGNVGIGTSSPLGKLKIAVGNVAPAASGDMNTGVIFETGATGHALNMGVDGTAGYSWINAAFANNSGVPNNLVLMTGATERMRIDSSGFVGIGTASPTQKLNVVENGITWCVSNNGASFTGTISNHDLVLITNSTEKMRITSGGEVYIAGTTDQGAYNLQCNGTGVWGAGAYVNGSDRNLKDNITPLGSCLDVVAALKPVTYQYKEEYSKDQSVQPGFIAQDLQDAMAGKEYLEGIVQAGPNHLNVAYQNLIPILTKALQEQQSLIQDLTTRLTALEGN